jgi:ribonuclease HII
VSVPVVAGVDEAGRGPLAGPVVAAAVVLPSLREIEGLADSKALSPSRRAALDELVRAHARAWAIGIASPEEVDHLNILQATFLAMRRAVRSLPRLPELCLVDGNLPIPHLGLPQRTMVNGDASEPCISAASVLAKVWRDRLMEQQDRLYPGYGFAGHKGYCCPAHLDALARLGPSPIHRRSFRPVRELAQAALRV